MIAFVHGTAVDMTENSVIVEAGGIGYDIYMTGTDLSNIHMGEEVKIHTYFNVREDAMKLYGFRSKDDLQMFKLLELKDKMKLEDAFELKLAHEQENAAAGMGDISDGRQEAVEALVALGYSSTDALRAVRKVTDVAPDDVEGLLKAALKNF